jgi:membrane protein YdbS with pleckstrin-like domain
MEETDLTKLHPDHRKVMAISAAIGGLIPLGAATIVEVAAPLPFGLFLGPTLLFCIWIVLDMPTRRYRAKGYDLGEDRLRVVGGVLFRKDTIVPFGRVQHLDVEQGPIERAFGLATLVLHTAGNHNSSVRLPGLANELAIEMREIIRAHIKRETM